MIFNFLYFCSVQHYFNESYEFSQQIMSALHSALITKVSFEFRDLNVANAHGPTTQPMHINVSLVMYIKIMARGNKMFHNYIYERMYSPIEKLVFVLGFKV